MGVTESRGGPGLLPAKWSHPLLEGHRARVCVCGWCLNCLGESLTYVLTCHLTLASHLTLESACLSLDWSAFLQM